MQWTLVVDDHEENFYLIKTILSTRQINARWAKNGVEALQMARQETPEMVISDILMPVMDGFELCRTWKQDETLRQIPFVFYTATYVEPEDLEFALSLGADGFIAKNTEPQAFLDFLHDILSKFNGGREPALQPPDETDHSYYRLYSQALVRKLEDKLAELERANLALKQSETNYKFLFENNPFPMWIYDLETLRFLTVNDAACQVYGYTREEFLSMTLKDIRPLEDLPALQQNVQTHHENYQQSGPWRHRLKDGRIIFVEITSHAILYQGKKGRFVVVQDITERKKAEDALRLQSAALNSAANAIVITDVDGRIQWVNPAFERLTGYPKEEAVGQNPRILNSGVHPKQFFTNLWNTLLEGKVWHSEIINRRKNGSVYYEEETITPLFDPEQRITHFIAVKQDITQRKESEKKLRDNEERLRLTLEAAHQGIFDLNLQTGEMIINDIYATMLGQDPATFVETNSQWRARLHPDDHPHVDQVYNAYVNNEIPEYRVEYRQKMPDGSWKWILSLGSIVERDAEGKPLRMMGVHTDINESKKASLEIARLFDESQRRLSRLATLRKIDIAISSDQHMLRILETLLAQVQSQLQVDAAAVLLFNEAKQTFEYTASVGFSTEDVKRARVPYGTSLAGRAAQINGCVRLDPCQTPNLHPGLLALCEKEGFRTYFGFPLVFKDRLKGVLELFHRQPLDPDQEWLDYYETLAGQAAMAVENAQLITGLHQANEDLIQAYDATIEGWSIAMDLRDRETEGHTLRVTEMTVALARRLNLSDSEIAHVRRGALLHDIGKVGVPDSILLKPGRLTPEERQIIEKHPIYAFNMLQSIAYLRPALDIPHLHHEKWDGSGYPYGLKGEQIPLTARLFALVDVYDALTSDRPYRLAWSKEETIAYIQEQSGKHFDPTLVALFLEYLRENPDL